MVNKQRGDRLSLAVASHRIALPTRTHSHLPCKTPSAFVGSEFFGDCRRAGGRPQSIALDRAASVLTLSTRNVNYFTIYRLSQ